MYKLEFHKKVLKDIEKLKENKLEIKAKKLIEIIKENPFQTPPPFEKLVGNLDGFISRRINIQHRLIYQVLEDKKVIRIISLWSHYEF
mgnify:CR=1 FL=1